MFKRWLNKTIGNNITKKTRDSYKYDKWKSKTSIIKFIMYIFKLFNLFNNWFKDYIIFI